MEIRQLQYFATIAHMGGFRTAADALAERGQMVIGALTGAGTSWLLILTSAEETPRLTVDGTFSARGLTRWPWPGRSTARIRVA